MVFLQNKENVVASQTNNSCTAQSTYGIFTSFGRVELAMLPSHPVAAATCLQRMQLVLLPTYQDTSCPTKRVIVNNGTSSLTVILAEVRSTAVAVLPHWSASCRNKELGLPS